MAQAIIMPRQGITVESCIITKWYKAQGDKIEAGEVLFSYETDKAAFEEKVQEEGTVLRLFYEEGDIVPCLETVSIIGQPGEDISSLLPSSDSSESAQSPTPVIEISNSSPIEVSVTGSAGTETKASPRAKMTASRIGADLSIAMPSGPDGRIIERDVLRLAAEGRLTTRSADTAQGRTGTGIGGRVRTTDEIETVASAPTPEISNSDPAYHDVPLTNIRKVIARSMHASLNEMAQLTHHSSFDASEILAYRSLIKKNQDSMGMPNITLGDMVLYAVSRVLPEFPELNAHYLGDAIRCFETVNLGLAVDTERGLMVPTIFGADHMSLSELSASAKDVAARSRSASISPDALTGGSFTVSNLGNYGIESFTPVINPPQTGILGVCSITYRPRPAKDGSMEFYPAMGLSLTYDHRALDGAPASKFLKRLCDSLENFQLLLAK